ncbi:hypothetical protein Aperf_G00000021535 [Anoplocephala perfoliata]
MSSQKSQAFSELESLDEIIQAVSVGPKSDHDHSHHPECCHHHQHNHSHGNNEDDLRSQSTDMNSKHLRSFWIVVPFIILFLLKEAVLHSTGLWVLISLFVSSFYLNSRVTNATQGFERPIYALVMSAFICANICLMYYLSSFRGKEYYLGLFCMPNLIPSGDWISLLWAMIMVDVSLKIFTIFFKSIVVFLASRRFFHISTRSAILVWIEFVSQFYRNLPPAVTWIRHLTGDSTHALGFRIVFCALYIFLKIVALGMVVFSMWPIFKSQTFSLPYQTNLISSAGDKELCALCFEKQSPKLAILGCNHTFCRDCIDRWLIYNNECPLCSRSLGEEFRAWRDGSTSALVYFF